MWQFSTVIHLENMYCSEVCQVMHFLLSLKVSAVIIHQQLLELYGSDVLSRPHVAKCCYMFASGRDSVADNNQIGECSPVMEVNTIHVKELFQMDKCVILQHIVCHVGFAYGSVWHVGDALYVNR